MNQFKAINVNEMNRTYAVYIVYPRYDSSTDAFVGVSFQRVPNLPTYNDPNDALIAADQWNDEHPDAAPEGSDRLVCVQDDLGNTVTRERSVNEDDFIPF